MSLGGSSSICLRGIHQTIRSKNTIWLFKKIFCHWFLHVFVLYLWGVSRLQSLIREPILDVTVSNTSVSSLAAVVQADTLTPVPIIVYTKSCTRTYVFFSVVSFFRMSCFYLFIFGIFCIDIFSENCWSQVRSCCTFNMVCSYNVILSCFLLQSSNSYRQQQCRCPGIAANQIASIWYCRITTGKKRNPNAIHRDHRVYTHSMPVGFFFYIAFILISLLILIFEDFLGHNYFTSDYLEYILLYFTYSGWKI